MNCMKLSEQLCVRNHLTVSEGSYTQAHETKLITLLIEFTYFSESEDFEPYFSMCYMKVY